MRVDRMAWCGLALVAAFAAGAVVLAGRSETQVANGDSRVSTVDGGNASSIGRGLRVRIQSMHPEVSPRPEERSRNRHDVRPAPVLMAGSPESQPGVLSLAEAAQLPQGPIRESAYVALSLEAAREHPRLALRLLAETKPGPASDDAVLHAVRQWALREPDLSGAWARQIESEALRLRALVSVATLWADRDPRAAAHFAIDAIPPGRRQADAIVGIVQRWAQQDAATAAAWVAQFPEGDLQHAAGMNLIQQWVQQDAPAAAAWINSLQASLLRDHAVEEFIRYLAVRDPVGAELWASTLSTTQAIQQAQAYLGEQRYVDSTAVLAATP